MLVALALAVVAAVKLLSDTSSEEIEVVEPYGKLHQGPKLFDFSNMKVAGSSTLIILGTLAAVSYFCRRRIISKLSRNQAPFVPSQPIAAAPRTSCLLQPGPPAWHCSPTSTTRHCPSPSVVKSRISAASRRRSMPPASPPALRHPPARSPPVETLTGSSWASDWPPSYYMTAPPAPPPTERPRTWRKPCAALTRMQPELPWPRPPARSENREGGARGYGRRRRGDGAILIYSH